MLQGIDLVKVWHRCSWHLWQFQRRFISKVELELWAHDSRFTSWDASPQESVIDLIE